MKLPSEKNVRIREVGDLLKLFPDLKKSLIGVNPRATLPYFMAQERSHVPYGDPTKVVTRIIPANSYRELGVDMHRCHDAILKFKGFPVKVEHYDGQIGNILDIFFTEENAWAVIFLTPPIAVDEVMRMKAIQSIERVRQGIYKQVSVSFWPGSPGDDGFHKFAPLEVSIVAEGKLDVKDLVCVMMSEKSLPTKKIVRHAMELDPTAPATTEAPAATPTPAPEANELASLYNTKGEIVAPEPVSFSARVFMDMYKLTPESFSALPKEVIAKVEEGALEERLKGYVAMNEDLASIAKLYPGMREMYSARAPELASKLPAQFSAGAFCELHNNLKDMLEKSEKAALQYKRANEALTRENHTKEVINTFQGERFSKKARSDPEPTPAAPKQFSASASNESHLPGGLSPADVMFSQSFMSRLLRQDEQIALAKMNQ